MKKITALLISTATALSCLAAGPTFTVDASRAAGKVSPMLYGLMTEEIQCLLWPNRPYEGQPERWRRKQGPQHGNLDRPAPYLFQIEDPAGLSPAENREAGRADRSRAAWASLSKV